MIMAEQELATLTTAAGTVNLSPDGTTQTQSKNRLLIRSEAAADSFQNIMTNMMAAAAERASGISILYQNWLGSMSGMAPSITANSIAQINASSAASTLAPVVLSDRLSNSANPSIPSNANTLPGNQGPFGPSSTGTGKSGTAAA
jgi:hypothetical protein